MMAIMRTGILVCLLCMSGGASAVESVEQQLKSFLAATHTLRADFKQVSYDRYGNPSQASSGLFYLSRPGKFRWQYQKPFLQEIVSNAGKVWFYDIDLEQVTIKTIDESLGATPALLLSGEVALEENFTLSYQGQEQALDWLKLTPKNPDSGFNYVLIGLSDGRLAGMELSDNFGQLTRIDFENLKINPTLADTMFQLEIPEGVDVLEQ